MKIIFFCLNTDLEKTLNNYGLDLETVQHSEIRPNVGDTITLESWMYLSRLPYERIYFPVKEKFLGTRKLQDLKIEKVEWHHDYLRVGLLARFKTIKK